MTRTLILLRHAKSAWPDGIPDAQRPLAGRGRRDASAVGDWLRGQVARIDLVVCSPAVRATQTWDLAAAQLEAIPPVRRDERLYGASAEELLKITQELSHTTSTVAMVGHNPGLEDFLELLTGTTEVLRTSAIAIVTTLMTWTEAKAHMWTVETLATPRGS